MLMNAVSCFPLDSVVNQSHPPIPFITKSCINSPPPTKMI